MAKTAASMGIPYDTLTAWRYQTWWDRIASEIRTEGHLELSNKLKKVAEKALETTLDRLDNGEWILNQKTGELVRKPVSMKDAHKVAESMIDRALDLEKKPVDEAHNQKVENTLAQLAENFARMAMGLKPIKDTIEYEDVTDAVQVGETEALPLEERAGDSEEVEPGVRIKTSTIEEKEEV